MPTAQINWLAFAILIIASFFELYFIWGLLFIYWSVRSYVDQTLYLITPIYRGETPILYWSLSTLWFLFGIWYVISDGLPRLGFA